MAEAMALLDHFHPPLSMRRHWHSFHQAWSTYLADALNQSLPAEYFVEPNAQFGIKVDVATFKEASSPDLSGRDNSDRRLAQWQPQSPTATLPFQPTTDMVEVQIFSTQAGPILVGAIALISPANKDRPAHRQAFVAKCQTYLQQEIGLIIVDLVTTLSANLHNELMSCLELPIAPLASELYAIAYRINETNGQSVIDLWQESLQVGKPLPSLPLYLKGGLYVPIHLAETYEYTCTRQRILEVR